jgi:hypothetical protein
VLDEIADRHRRDGNDGAWFATTAIEAAGSTDPLKAVIDADRLWQDSQRRRADAEERDWQATKAQDRTEAGAAPTSTTESTGDVLGRMGGPASADWLTKREPAEAKR